MARQDDEIQIPAKLLEQIQSKTDKGDYDDDDSRFTVGLNKRKREDGKSVSRKERRKQEREEKKKKKQKPNTKAASKSNENVSKSKKTTSEKPKPSKKNALKSDDGVRIVKESDLDDEYSGSDFDDQIDEDGIENGDFDDEDFGGFDDEDFGGFDDDTDDLNELENESNDDPLAQLKAIKEAKKQKADRKTENKADDPLARLKALKEAKKQGKPIEEFQDLDDENMDDEDLNSDGSEDYSLDEMDENDFDSEEEDLEEEDDPLAKLKALKQAKSSGPKDKKEKKEKKKDKKDKKESYAVPIDAASQRDEEDMTFYAKKLGLKDGRKSKLSKIDDNDEIGGLLDGLDFDFGASASENEDISDFPEEDDSQDELMSDDEEAPKKKENPYVAPTADNSSGDENEGEQKQAYIPPALRKKLLLQGDVSEEVLALRRSLKGLLNKLSESNISSIVNDINGLYLNNPRSVVNTELTEIILNSVIQQGRLLDTFVYLHATVVAALYRLQGVEFGAHFIQTLIEKFEQQQKENTKIASNLGSLLSSVYLFNLVSSRLLYDIIKVLINDLNEQNADLLLRLIRNSGNQMRSDDPSALKDIVLLVNQVFANMPKDKVTTRTQFLVETIASLKNNKMKINNEANHQLSIRLKKFLGSINNNKINDPIQVGLDDIHNIATRGKWWLVGSAWKGHDKVEEEKDNKIEINDVLDNAEPNWMELARAQRMNTDIRRAIFISIMSATDYVDAMTKLDKLSLKRAQEKEIPRVLVHCTGVEPSWNPYYGVLASKLCADHKYRKAFQFMLWDLIKEFEGSNGDNLDDEEVFTGFDHNESDESRLKRILNLGRFFGYLLAEGALPLHILRTVNFLTATNDNVLFMEVLFVKFLDQVAKKSQVNSVGAGLTKKSGSMHEHKFDDKILIERILKANDQTVLLRGIQMFLLDKVLSSSIIEGKKQKKRIDWGVNAAIDVIDEVLKNKQNE